MQPLKKVVILGGGTTGWMCAAMLANSINKKHLRIELVESEQIGTIGVGESTVPPFMSMLASLGIDEVDFIQSTQATFKLGIKFQDWLKKGHDFFHPFGKIDARMDESSLYHAWLKGVLKGDAYTQLMDLSPNGVMARHKRFAPYKAVQGTLLADSRYALHLDAGLVARYLANYSKQRGVIRTEGKVERVLLGEPVNPECEAAGIPSVQGLTLEGGKVVDGDFFIDCSGFRSLILGETLKTPFIDWSKYLPCNKAVVVQSEALDEAGGEGLPPYTKATAQTSGWTWRIPLQHRTGNGYVFAGEYESEADATETLLKNIKGKNLTDPRVLHFTTGMREQLWKSNCIAVGLAAGFIEPLESTAIHLAMRGIAEFLQQFPHGDCSPALVSEYNENLRQDYHEIRDFIILHYATSARTDTEFWRYCRQMDWPASLTQSVEYFKAKGDVPRMLAPLFEGTSWRCLCEGMAVRPKAHSVFVEGGDYKQVKQHILAYRGQLHDLVQQVPTHRQFLNDQCKAPPVD